MLCGVLFLVILLTSYEENQILVSCMVQIAYFKCKHGKVKCAKLFLLWYTSLDLSGYHALRWKKLVKKLLNC